MGPRRLLVDKPGTLCCLRPLVSTAELRDVAVVVGLHYPVEDLEAVRKVPADAELEALAKLLVDLLVDVPALVVEVVLGYVIIDRVDGVVLDLDLRVDRVVLADRRIHQVERPALIPCRWLLRASYG